MLCVKSCLQSYFQICETRNHLCPHLKLACHLINKFHIFLLFYLTSWAILLYTFLGLKWRKIWFSPDRRNLKLSIEPLESYLSFEAIYNTLKFIQQIYLKTWLDDNLIINASLFMLLISLLILLVKKHCGNNKNGFIVGYNVHTRTSQTPAARRLSDVEKIIHDSWPIY